MEAHQHAETEDTHVVEITLENSGTDTTVAEDTQVHEVLQNSGRKMDPPVVETHLDISGLNITVVEDTPVCEVLVGNSKNEDPHLDEVQNVVRNEDSQEAEHDRVRVGDNMIYNKQYTKKRAVPSLDYKIKSYAAWWRRVERKKE